MTTEATPLHRCRTCGTLSRLGIEFRPLSRVTAHCSRCAAFTEHEIAYTSNEKEKRNILAVQNSKPLEFDGFKKRLMARLAFPARWIPKAWRDWRRGYTMAERDSMLWKISRPGTPPTLTPREIRAFRDHCLLIGPGDV